MDGSIHQVYSLLKGKPTAELQFEFVYDVPVFILEQAF